MFGLLKKWIEFIEKRKIDLNNWLITFTALISTRLLIEAILLKFPPKNLESFVVLFSHTFLFFLLTYLLIFGWLFFITREDFKKISNFLLWGFLIILIPPITDKIIFGNKIYKSFYIFDNLNGLIVRFFTFFGKNPDWGITWGTRINIFIAIVFVGFYVFLKTKTKTKTIIGVFGVYFIFFILSCFPSLIVLFLRLIQNKNVLDFSYSVVAGYFITPYEVFGLKTIQIENFLPQKLSLFYLFINFIVVLILLFNFKFKKTWSLVKNIRFPQIFFNIGLLFIGLSLGFFYNKTNFRLDVFEVFLLINLVLLVIFCWFFSVLINDLSDLGIDEITNKNRPLVTKDLTKKEYKEIALVVFLFSVFSSLIVGPIFFLITMTYHFLTYIYSCEPLRIKRIPVLAGLLISLASLNFLIMGFMVFSEHQTLNSFPWVVYWFLFVVYFFIIPVKDLKDIEGDRVFEVFTIPVLIGEKNTKNLLAVILFSVYMLSVYFLNKKELFLPALIFGGISFWILNNKKIKNTSLNFWLLWVVFLYGLCLVKIVFF